jgi:hypothetical protein
MKGPIANIVLAEADTNSEEIHDESEAAEKGKEQRFETGTASES